MHKIAFLAALLETPRAMGRGSSRGNPFTRVGLPTRLLLKPEAVINH
jgi:hypothetical protein